MSQSDVGHGGYHYDDDDHSPSASVAADLADAARTPSDRSPPPTGQINGTEAGRTLNFDDASSSSSQITKNKDMLDLGIMTSVIQDQISVSDYLSGKKLTMIIGYTRVGKTCLTNTLLGVPLERKLVPRSVVMRGKTIDLDPEEVVDRPEKETRGCKIGLSADSETERILAFPMPNDVEWMIADSRGLFDTRGISYDAGNVVALQHAIKLAKVTTIVVVLRCESLSTPEYLKNHKDVLAGALQPLKDHLDSVAVIFSRPEPHHTSKRLLAEIAKAANSDFASQDDDFAAFLEHIIVTLNRHKEKAIYRPLEPTSKPDVLSVIESCSPLTHEDAQQLGCPLVGEVRAQLEAKCKELAIQLDSHLKAENIPQVAEIIDTIDQLNDMIVHADVQEAHQACHRIMSDCVTNHKSQIDQCLKDRSQWQKAAHSLNFIARLAERVSAVSETCRTIKAGASQCISKYAAETCAALHSAIDRLELREEHAKLLSDINAIETHLRSFYTHKPDYSLESIQAKVMERIQQAQDQVSSVYSALTVLAEHPIEAGPSALSKSQFENLGCLIGFAAVLKSDSFAGTVQCPQHDGFCEQLSTGIGKAEEVVKRILSELSKFDVTQKNVVRLGLLLDTFVQLQKELTASAPSPLSERPIDPSVQDIENAVRSWAAELAKPALQPQAGQRRAVVTSLNMLEYAVKMSLLAPLCRPSFQQAVDSTVADIQALQDQTSKALTQATNEETPTESPYIALRDLMKHLNEATILDPILVRNQHVQHGASAAEGLSTERATVSSSEEVLKQLRQKLDSSFDDRRQALVNAIGQHDFRFAKDAAERLDAFGPVQPLLTDPSMKSVKQALAAFLEGMRSIDPLCVSLVPGMKRALESLRAADVFVRETLMAISSASIWEPAVNAIATVMSSKVECLRENLAERSAMLDQAAKEQDAGKIKECMDALESYSQLDEFLQQEGSFHFQRAQKTVFSLAQTSYDETRTAAAACDFHVMHQHRQFLDACRRFEEHVPGVSDLANKVQEEAHVVAKDIKQRVDHAIAGQQVELLAKLIHDLRSSDEVQDRLVLRSSEGPIQQLLTGIKMAVEDESFDALDIDKDTVARLHDYVRNASVAAQLANEVGMDGQELQDIIVDKVQDIFHSCNEHFKSQFRKLRFVEASAAYDVLLQFRRLDRAGLFHPPFSTSVDEAEKMIREETEKTCLKRLDSGLGDFSAQAPPQTNIIDRVLKSCNVSAEQQALYRLGIDFEEIVQNVRQRALSFWKTACEGVEAAMLEAMSLEDVRERVEHLNVMMEAKIFAQSPQCKTRLAELKNNLEIRENMMVRRLFDERSERNIDELLEVLAKRPLNEQKQAAKETAEFLHLRDRIADDPLTDPVKFTQWLKCVDRLMSCIRGCLDKGYRMFPDFGGNVEEHLQKCIGSLSHAVRNKCADYVRLHEEGNTVECLEDCRRLNAMIKEYEWKKWIPKLAEDVSKDIQLLDRSFGQATAALAYVQQLRIDKDGLPFDVLQSKLDDLMRVRSSTPSSPSKGLGGQPELQPYDEAVAHFCGELRRAEGIIGQIFQDHKWKEAGTLRQNISGVARLTGCGEITQPAANLSEYIDRQLRDLSGRLIQDAVRCIESHNYDAFNKLYDSIRDAEKNGLMEAHDELRRAVEVQKARIVQRFKPSNTSESKFDDLSETLVELRQHQSSIRDATINCVFQDGIEEVLEKIKTGHRKWSQDDVFRLATRLEQSGPHGMEVIHNASIFKSALVDRLNKMTAGVNEDDAIRMMLQAGDATDEQAGRLKNLYQTYENAFKKVLGGQFSWSDALINEQVQAVSRQARNLKGSCENYQTVKTQLPELLGHICAVWSMLESNKFGEGAHVLMRPHPTQILGMFKLLGLDSKEISWLSSKATKFAPSAARAAGLAKMRGAFVQVGTGQGKSILLGILSTLLALIGFRVDCACYHELLCKRDEEAFRELFEKFGIASFVSYKTLRQLANDLITEKGDVRDFGISIFKSKKPKHLRASKDGPRILLMDEADVFFIEDFFGGTYNPVVSYRHQALTELIQWMWNKQSDSLRFEQVKIQPQYSAVLNAIGSINEPILESEVRRMITDLKVVRRGHHTYVVTADKQIGYELHGTVSTTTNYGYMTMFAYLKEAQLGNIPQSTATSQLGLSLKCGNFSYAQMPKIYHSILGVTGTLDCLSEEEKKLMRDEYSIERLSKMPSMYGESQLDFQKLNSAFVLSEPDETRYFQRIAQTCAEMRQRKRATLVFFETKKRLEKFLYSTYGQSIGDLMVITESTPEQDIDHYVQKATRAGSVSIWTAAFGRGTDYKALDAEVDAAGGVHVIQTYFSTEESEEIQVKGRTARQKSKGSYQLVMLDSDLVGSLSLTAADLQQAKDEGRLYPLLADKRQKLTSERIRKLKEAKNKASSDHEKSIRFQTAAREGDIDSARQLLFGFHNLY